MPGYARPTYLSWTWELINKETFKQNVVASLQQRNCVEPTLSRNKLTLLSTCVNLRPSGANGECHRLHGVCGGGGCGGGADLSKGGRDDGAMGLAAKGDDSKD